MTLEQLITDPRIIYREKETQPPQPIIEIGGNEYTPKDNYKFTEEELQELTQLLPDRVTTLLRGPKFRRTKKVPAPSAPFSRRR